MENLIPFRGACTHTTGPGWWVVDLEDDYIINKVWIKNRIDCCSDRIDGVKVTYDLIKTTSLVNYQPCKQDASSSRFLWSIPNLSPSGIR